MFITLLLHLILSSAFFNFHRSFGYIILTYTYLCETRQKRADGSTVIHLQLAESVWNPHKKRSEVRILYNSGRAEDPKTAERLKKLAQTILRKCDPEKIVQHSDQWHFITVMNGEPGKYKSQKRL